MLRTNVATGICLILPGDAKSMRRLHEFAAAQLTVIFSNYDIYTEPATQEIQARLSGEIHYGKTSNRSVLASATGRKDKIWHSFAHQNLTANEKALALSDDLYQHPNLERPEHNAVI